MSATGFILRGLRLVGDGRFAGELPFERGLNIISGASNTGKTFAVECIDFMLGGSTRPREVVEARGYAEALLGLEAAHGKSVTLRRPLAGGKFRLIDAPLAVAEATPARVQLSERHNPRQATNISTYLLGLCGLHGRNIVCKTSGETRQVSFRNVLPLALVPEAAMFRRGPLFLSGQYTERVAETSVFRLILSGVDAGTPGARRDPKAEKVRTAAQLELLDDLIRQAELELATLSPPEEPAITPEELEAALVSASTIETDARSQLAQLSEQRQMAWRDREMHRRQLTGIDGLLQRFGILRAQYESDLTRLVAIAEAQYFFGQLSSQTCPLCGAEQAIHSHTDDNPDGDLRAAAAREVEKIQTRLVELAATMSFLMSERARHVDSIATFENNLVRIDNIIAQTLKPQILAASKSLAALHARRANLERAAKLRAQLASLRAMRSSRVKPTSSGGPKGALEVGSAPELALLCAEIQELLIAWCFPGDRTVRFEPTMQDFIVSGQARANYGKGLLAIINAAFAVGLMLHCRARGIPHPGFVVLDSPLVTFRKKDVPPNEAITDDLRDAVFEDLVDRTCDSQVIIFENEIPPDGVRARCSYVRFTANLAMGRAGLLPRHPT